MTLTSIGDLTQTHFLRRQTAGAKADMDRLTAEMTTGKVTDAGAHLGGDFSALAGIDSSLARLRGYATATTQAGMIADVQQRALSQIDDAAVAASGTLIAAAFAPADGIAAAARQAQDALAAAIGALNLRHADRAVFAGADGDGVALAGADAVMASARQAVAGVTGGPAVVATVESWFTDAAGFGAAYRGGPPAPPVPVAPGMSVSLDVTAADPALGDTLKSLILGALLTDDAVGGGRDARAHVARVAGEGLAGAAPARAALAGRLGIVQQRLDQTAAQNSAEDSALSIARNGLVATDPYDTATRLQDAQSRLEMIYTLTARLSRLTLADYL